MLTKNRNGLIVTNMSFYELKKSLEMIRSQCSLQICNTPETDTSTFALLHSEVPKERSQHPDSALQDHCLPLFLLFLLTLPLLKSHYHCPSFSPREKDFVLPSQAQGMGYMPILRILTMFWFLSSRLGVWASTCVWKEQTVLGMGYRTEHGQTKPRKK